MMKSLLLFISVICFGALACLNYKLHVVKKDGSITGADELAYVPSGNQIKDNRQFYEQLLSEQYVKVDMGYDPENYNDYGVTLVFLEKYLQAQKVFKVIEKKTPNLYATAANLGTVYELLGKNDSALYWISKAVKIAPASHDSSEWIHVNILKVKVSGCLKGFSGRKLIGVDFGSDSMPSCELPVARQITLQKQIYYQLSERMTFVKPKDQIVAQLLFDLGNLVALNEDLNSALAIYKLANDYGMDTELLSKRVNKMNLIRNKALNSHGKKRN